MLEEYDMDSGWRDKVSRQREYINKLYNTALDILAKKTPQEQMHFCIMYSRCNTLDREQSYLEALIEELRIS